jgi:phosphoglycolate phosphatase
LVCGDCLAQRKPDPEPILHACRLLGVAPQHTIYVGDDARDIEAGQRAGTMTVAAAWGYLDGEDAQTWDADCVAATPAALLGVLGLSECA